MSNRPAATAGNEHRGKLKPGILKSKRHTQPCLLRLAWLSLLTLGQVLPCFPETFASQPAALVLFNGTNLTGFYTWLVDTKYTDPRQVFTVSNGVLHISGDGLGYLATTKEFANYRLVAEYKWGERNWPWGNRTKAARDSGIFLHSIGPDGSSHDGNGAFRAAIECQIFEGATGDFLLIRGTNTDGTLIAPRISAEVARKTDAEGWPYWQKGGEVRTITRWGRLNWFDKEPEWRDVIDFRGRRDVEKPRGEWNRIECICDNDRISVILNGVMVNQILAVFPRRGKILLQCEGSEIYFRKLDLHPLAPSAKLD